MDLDREHGHRSVWLRHMWPATFSPARRTTAPNRAAIDIACEDGEAVSGDGWGRRSPAISPAMRSASPTCTSLRCCSTWANFRKAARCSRSTRSQGLSRPHIERKSVKGSMPQAAPGTAGTAQAQPAFRARASGRMMSRARPDPAPDRMAALGDPVRRAIFEMLAEGPRSVGDIAGRGCR